MSDVWNAGGGCQDRHEAPWRRESGILSREPARENALKIVDAILDVTKADDL